jgi:septum formation protein
VAAPLYKETMDQSVAPELLVKHLACHKAASLRERYPEALIIGADQVFVNARGQILGKPQTAEKAVQQLREMSGRSHVFYTGLSVFDAASGEALTDVSTYTVTLRTLSDGAIADYVARENPVDCAGSFKIEGLGIALMEKMEGDDYTTLIGLPLILLTDLLLHFGVEILPGGGGR